MEKPVTLDTRQAFARALRQARGARGMTQEDFSLVSSRTYLSTLERGLKSPTLDKVEALCGALGIHPLTLLMLTYLDTEDRGAAVTGELLERIAVEIAAIHSAAPGK